MNDDAEDGGCAFDPRHLLKGEKGTKTRTKTKGDEGLSAYIWGCIHLIIISNNFSWKSTNVFLTE